MSISRIYSVRLELKKLFQRRVEPGVPNKQRGPNFLQKRFTETSK